MSLKCSVIGNGSAWHRVAGFYGHQHLLKWRTVKKCYIEKITKNKQPRFRDFWEYTWNVSYTARFRFQHVCLSILDSTPYFCLPHDRCSWLVHMVNDTTWVNSHLSSTFPGSSLSVFRWNLCAQSFPTQLYILTEVDDFDDRPQFYTARIYTRSLSFSVDCTYMHGEIQLINT